MTISVVIAFVVFTVLFVYLKQRGKIGSDVGEDFSVRGFKVKDSTKTNPDDYDPIDIYTGKLIQRLITITQDAREQAPNSKKKYIFLYKADNKQTVNKLTRAELSRAINNTAKELCIPQLGTKGIRNHFDRKLNQFDFEGKANGTIVSAVSKHSMAVHIKHYSDAED